MRDINRKRVLLISCSVIVICTAIITGMTFALFTDQEIVTNHLKAGNLDVTLTRTSLTSTYLTPRGFLETTTNEIDKDFTNNKKDNVFGLNDGDIIVPKNEYVAEMQIANNGDVAFAYWIEIVYTGKEDVALANQISVAFNSGAAHRLNKGVALGSAEEPLGVMAAGDTMTFTVAMKFLDLENNNDAQGDRVTFDLVVHAVQYTGADPNPAS